jgi:DNA (cytosine-5)-methyltransferase 1
MGTLRSGHNEGSGVPFVALAFGWNKSPSQTMQVGETCDALQASPTSNPAVLTPAIAFQERGRDGGRSLEWQKELAHSLNAPSGGGRRHELDVLWQWAVRRLVPTECERLQGFPDGYTLVPYRGKPAADGPRYKALGNSMAVPVMRWIGRRILEVANP